MRASVSAFSAGFAFLTAAWPQMDRSGWTLMNGVDGGPVYDMAAGEGAILAATGRHNVFRSLDSGKTWLPFPVPGASSGVQYESRPARVFFDPAAKLFYSVGDSGLYAAAPAAPAWNRILGGRASSLSADGPTIILLTGQSEGVKVSRDRGLTWKSAAYPVVGLNILGVLAADSCVYASDMGSPVSVSCDGGASWKYTGGDSLSHYTYAMARIPGGVLAAAGRGLVRTMDRGKTWSPWAGNLAGENRVWALNQSAGSIFASEQQRNLFRSTDYGLTWTAVSSPIVQTLSSYLPPSSLAESAGRIYAGTPNGVFASRDGGATWSALDFGLMKSPILSLGVRGPAYLAFTERGVYASGDSGAVWRLALPNDSASKWTAFGGSGSLFAAGNHKAQVRITGDAGATWSAIESLPGTGAVIGLAAAGATLLAATADGLWRREYPAGSWTGLALPGGDRPRIVAGGSASFYICGDAGLWELRGDGSLAERQGGLEPFQAQGIWMAGERPYLATRDGYAYRWDAQAAAWKRMADLGGFCFSIAGAGTNLVASTSQGLWVSENSGAKWTAMRFASSVSGEIRALIFSDRRVYGGDESGGIWKMGWEFPEPPLGIPAPRARKAGIGGSETVRKIFVGRNRLANGRLAPP